MYYYGKIKGKDTMRGDLEDGRSMFVQDLELYDLAPEEEKKKPAYWVARCETGEFANPEAEPLVWIEEWLDGKIVRQYYAPILSREQATVAYNAAQQVALPERRKVLKQEVKQLARAYAVKQYAYSVKASKEVTDRVYERFAQIFDRLIAKYPELDLENNMSFLRELNDEAEAWWESRSFKGPAVDW